MAVIQAEDVADLLTTTQKELGEGRITDLTSDLQSKIAFPRLFNNERVVIRGGTSVQFNVLMNGDDNTRFVGQFEVDNLNQVDGAVTGNVPWRSATTGATYDVNQVAMNLGPRQIVSFVKEKMLQMESSWAEAMEEQFWGEPTSSTDEVHPFGIRYWVVYNATEGFNGGNNANFSGGPAGINRDTYDRWKNYTAQYTSVSVADLFRKLRKAMWSCNFSPSVENPPIPAYGGKPRYGVYTTYDVVEEAAEVLEARNDRLGPQVDAFEGKVTVQRNLLVAVPYLQQNLSTQAPLVGIDWSVFRVVGLQNRWMVRTPVKPAPNQHNVLQTFLDCTFNFVCYDCRRLFLLAKSSWH